MSKMKRCYTCGYEERVLSRVVYCVHCEEAMVHRYCMDPPRHGDEEFDWVCEACCPRVNNHSKSHRISEYLSLKLDSEAEKRSSRRRLKKLGCNSHDHEEDANKSVGSLKKFVAEVETLQTLVDICDDQPLKGEEIPEGFAGTDARPVKKLRWHSVPKDFGEQCDLKAKASNRTREGPGQSMEKDRDPAKCSPLQEPEADPRCNSNYSPRSNNSNSHLPRMPDSIKRSSSLIHDSNGHLAGKRSGIDVNKGSAGHQPTLGAGRYQLIPRVGDGSHKLIESLLPIPNVSWRGTCRVTHKMDRMSVELEAHLPNSANFKVSEVVRTLPSPLDLEMVDKFSGWPKRFVKELSCGDNIGLYFYPPRGGDRKPYDDLIGKMIVGNLVLRFLRSNLRLLVFSSLELPKGIQRFNGKFYLWGVFSAALSLPSSEKAGAIRHQLVSGHSSGSSCLEEDHANDRRRSCSPTGGEVQSVRIGQGSSDTIRPTRQNAHSNDQRCETQNFNGQNAHSPQPTCKSLKPASIPHQADLQKHDHAANGKRYGLQDPNVLVNPNIQIEGLKHSASTKTEDEPVPPVLSALRAHPPVDLKNHRPDSSTHQAVPGRHRDLPQSDKKRKRRKADFPDQGRELDSPGKFQRNHADKLNDMCKRGFNRSEKGNFNQQLKQNFGFPGAKQKKKNKKQKQKRLSPYKQQYSMPMNRDSNEAADPQPCASFPEAKNAMLMNGSFSPYPSPRANPHQGPSFSSHDVSINKNWNEQSHPQLYARFPVGQHAMPVTGQSHSQPYVGFFGGQHAMPVNGQSHPQPYACFPGGQYAMPMVGQSHHQPCASFPGGHYAVPATPQLHPQPQASFPGSQEAMPVTVQSHPQPYAGFPGGQQATTVTVSQILGHMQASLVASTQCQ